MRRVAAGGICLVALLLLAAPAWSLPRLHAERGPDPGVFTADGRQVLLRGVNVNQLGDYYRQSPALPPRFPLRRSDFRDIRGLGMNVVRLLVHWSKLEPEPGAFNTRYVARIRRAVRWAKARRIYVVLDMHQDAWGKAIASPGEETCAPGFVHAQGWDGAPAWATLTDGLPTCYVNQREFSPAVAAAFQSFYDDRDGIQAHLVHTWAKLARAVGDESTVAGYDLLNEPNPGFAIGVADAQSLARFYARAIAAIRGAESFPRIVFFEPGVIWSAAGTDAVPEVADPNAVFAPHLYAGSIAPISVEDGFRNAESAAAGATVWSGEWGWFGDPKVDEASIRTYAEQEDAHRWGGAWWDWKQACGDPHQFSNGDATEPFEISPSLNRFACPGNRPLGIPATTRRVLARPYVRFAPGRLRSLRSDPVKRTLEAEGTAGRCGLELWMPGRARPTVTGVTRQRAHRVRGGWTVTGCARGAWRLSAR